MGGEKPLCMKHWVARNYMSWKELEAAMFQEPLTDATEFFKPF
jgi:hypothetical protein